MEDRFENSKTQAIIGSNLPLVSLPKGRRSLSFSSNYLLSIFSSLVQSRFFILLGFLVFFSSCSDSHTDPLMQKANDEWIKGRNHHAIELFQAVLKKHPTGPLAEEALFRLGEIHRFSLEDGKTALNYFQEVLQMNQRSSFTYKSQKYIAEIIEFTFKDYNQAIIEYQKLINGFDRPEEYSDHQYRIASIYYKQQNYEQALIEWEDLLEIFPNSSWVNETQLKIVETLDALNRCPKAKEKYDLFLKKNPRTQFKDEMDFVMASCLEDEGKLREAYKKFKTLEGHFTYPDMLRMKLQGIEKRIKKKG